MLNTVITPNGPLAVVMVIVAITFGSINITITDAKGQLEVDEDISRLLGRCRLRSEDLDLCMKDTLNDFRAYFSTGRECNLL